MPKRIQRDRTAGWRAPESAIYVGRPGPWGNPFTVEGDWIMWVAVALGYRADKAGRTRAAVLLHRAWITGHTSLQIDAAARAARTENDWLIEFTSGRSMLESEYISHLAGRFANLFPMPPVPDELPDLSPLRGRDLMCWCPIECPQCLGTGELDAPRRRIDQPKPGPCHGCGATGRAPCHADTLIELANA